MTTNRTSVLIIGAGLSGIGVACRLRREFPDRDFAILERRDTIGGTWDLFRYPGVRSDSDMFSFGYEFRPWDELKVLADGGSIRDYISATAEEYGVDESIHHGLKVLTADWSSERQQWTVTALREATGETETWACSFLVTCTGYYDYDQGYLPEFPGAQRFEGTRIHPQHWPEDFDHTGKKIVVIGSGATAVTLVPAMADRAEHVTMLQRSPSYVFSLPSIDKITAWQRRFLPGPLVYRMTRWRNIELQRAIFKISRRFPQPMRRLLLAGVRSRVGKDFDMTHFSPKYDPWDERLCAVPDGDLFTALREGRASVVTDTIETFTATGIRLASGRELEADVIVTATGLNLQALGDASISVDGEVRDLHDVCTYKSVMLENIPNLTWVFGYTNASWTLKVDLAAAYLVRLLKHMDETGRTVAVPVDRAANATDDGVVDELSSGYIQRAKGVMPRQGRDFPWRMVMDYRHDRKVLLSDPIEDGILEFRGAPGDSRAPA
ncbi:NAD(P)/FAD-dependent oxidoreductase [Streptomyces sp. FH025]|uniref:flavin-containing monooxygenase n=1 Tax=Streptomyces sp. FH025 TaxID=2815937 RepID=UPI001A9F3BA1|nr:NAD(P)/FAD-dependent oxidoreductase [Streptomyces sp. FH025]MBO1413301.1 NAD(P)/FAD-dependent oxidoreductase [Streptomyces sp. FH025]